MKQLIIFILIIELSGCRSRGYVSDKDVYTFLNDFLQSGPPFNNYKDSVIADKELDSTVFTPNDSLALEKMDTVFSKEDVSFLIAQMKDDSDFKLDPDLIKGKKLISGDKLKTFGKVTDKRFWEKLKVRYGVEGFLTVSKPYFSKDKSKVIVSQGYYTRDGGSVESLLMIKVDGEWKYKEQLGYWEY